MQNWEKLSWSILSPRNKHCPRKCICYKHAPILLSNSDLFIINTQRTVWWTISSATHFSVCWRQTETGAICEDRAWTNFTEQDIWLQRTQMDEKSSRFCSQWCCIYKQFFMKTDNKNSLEKTKLLTTNSHLIENSELIN